MIRKTAGFLVLLLIAVATGSEPAWREDWRDDAIGSIARIGTDLTQSDFIKLLQLASIEDEREYSIEVSEAARERLASVDTLESLALGFLEESIAREEERSAEVWSSANLRRRPMLFEALQSVKTPASVAILGYCLSDSRDPWIDLRSGHAPPPRSNQYYAVHSLSRMQIKNAPLKTIGSAQGDYESALQQWQLWFEHLRSGRRTFRFESDPQLYNIHGPVDEPQTASSERRHRLVEATSSAVASPRRPPWLAIVIAIAALIAASGYALRQRRVS